MTGRFITFEGIDGAGKSTHIDGLARLAARRAAHEVVLTREPGGTPLAEQLRELVLHRADGRADRGAAGLRGAARPPAAAASSRRWRAAPSVLCDRFTDATFAYQGGGRGFDLQVLAQLEALGAAGPPARPDAVVRPAARAGGRSAARAARAPDRFERQDLAFFDRVRDGYAQRMRRRRSASCASTRRPTARACGRRSNRRWSSGRGGRPRRPAAAALAGGPLRQALRSSAACAAAAGRARRRRARVRAERWRRPGCARRPMPRRPAAAAAAAGWCSRARIPTCACCCPKRCAPRWAGRRRRRHAAKRARRARSPAGRSRSTRCAPPSTGSCRARRAAAPRWCCCTRPKRMNLQAANALLKTLEEPPGQARLLLSTADEARAAADHAQPLPAHPPGRARRAEQAAAWLAEQGVRDAPVLLAAAGGAPLAARDLAAAGVDAAAWLALPEAVARGQAARAGRLAGAARGRRAAEALPRRHGPGRGRRAALLSARRRCRRVPAWGRCAPGRARCRARRGTTNTRGTPGCCSKRWSAKAARCWQEATTRGPRSGKALDTLGR